MIPEETGLRPEHGEESGWEKESSQTTLGAYMWGLSAYPKYLYVTYVCFLSDLSSQRSLWLGSEKRGGMFEGRGKGNVQEKR